MQEQLPSSKVMNEYNPETSGLYFTGDKFDYIINHDKVKQFLERHPMT